MEKRRGTHRKPIGKTTGKQEEKQEHLWKAIGIRWKTIGKARENNRKTKGKTMGKPLERATKSLWKTIWKPNETPTKPQEITERKTTGNSRKTIGKP